MRAKDMTGTMDATPEEVEDVPAVIHAPRKNMRHVAAAAPQELYTNELILETPEQTAMITNAAAPEIVATTPIFTQRVYAEFAKEMRERLLKTNPDWSSHEVISEIGRLWGIHTQTHDYTSAPAAAAAAAAATPAAPPSRYASAEIPLPNPLYYSATNHPLSPQAFTAAKTEEVLNQKLADGPLTTEGPFGTQGGPPPSNARSYTKYSDEIRPWIIQTYPRWSVDQIIAETTRLWKIQQDKINAIKAEVAPPSAPVSRAPPSNERRSTAPPQQSELPTIIRGPRITDPIITINKPSSATATTRGARAAAAAQILARTPRQPPVPPGPPPSRGPAANGSAREIDWTKVLSALPKTLPDSKNEGHVLNAIMGVWNANEKK
jgi:hypothetical protein